MKIRLLLPLLLAAPVLPVSLHAQAPAPKPAPAKGPADLALDEFNKLRNAPASKTQAGFTPFIAAGIAYVTQFPTHNQIGTVVGQLGGFAFGIDAKQPALRASYVSLLTLEVTNAKYKEGVTDPAKAALAAIDAAVADYEMRANPTRETLATLREKIDALTETPGSTRFLAERERSYAHLLQMTNQAARAEEQLQKLAKHADKGISDMAKAELNMLDVKKKPFELKFTGIDGKETDLAQLRGKVVALYFWASTNKQSLDQIDQLKLIHSDYRKKGFEIVTVCYDKAEDREKVMKAIKDARISFPVHFDGTGNKVAFAGKLGAWSAPRLMLFDQKGILQTPPINNRLEANLPLNQLEGQVKRLLNIK